MVPLSKECNEYLLSLGFLQGEDKTYAYQTKYWGQYCVEFTVLDNGELILSSFRFINDKTYTEIHMITVSTMIQFKFCVESTRLWNNVLESNSLENVREVTHS